jgi:hypothetical protein
MTTEPEREESAAEPRQGSQGPDDEVEASISALEKAMLGAPMRDRKAIHELGCRIVAEAIKNTK